MNFGKINEMSMPARMAVIGPPTRGKLFPINQEGIAIAKQRKMPKNLFMANYIVERDF
jgi:hypothetical protein